MSPTCVNSTGRGVSEQVESCLDCLDMGTAVLLAGLTRALVVTALAEARQGTPPPAAPARWVGGALAAAARYGLAGPGVDPFTGRPADAHTLRWRLLDHVQAALSARGDAEHITTLVHRLDHLGTGADRQRALFAAAGPAPEFVLSAAEPVLDDVHLLSVGDLDLDPDHRVHRHLPQS